MENLELRIQASDGIIQKTRKVARGALKKDRGGEEHQLEFFFQRCNAFALIKFLVYQSMTNNVLNLSIFDERKQHVEHAEGSSEIILERIIGGGRQDTSEIDKLKWQADTLVIAGYKERPDDEQFAAILLSKIQEKVKDWRKGIFNDVLDKSEIQD